jgi:hypothetical protein
MIDRYAPGETRAQVRAPEPASLAYDGPELTPLAFDRDERLAAERSAA